tara:strand:+ start:176 stop:946 length:771 start_codon:yes stop_codon:yes gene_type:complete
MRGAMHRVKGKIALITGGASGIGKAAAILLAEEGAQIIVSDINVKSANETANEIGNSAIAYEHDVTDEGSWKILLSKIKHKFGHINILVNCAGIAMIGNIEETTLEDWKNIHAVDLDSIFLGCKTALPIMVDNGPGSIINLSSISGIIAGHNLAAYNSAKAGVRHLTKSIALHCAKKKYDIRCNSVHPAFINTNMLDDILPKGNREESLERLSRQVPLGRIGEVKDVAWAIVYLASEESKFMTGAEIVLDGGLSAG